MFLKNTASLLSVAVSVGVMTLTGCSNVQEAEPKVDTSKPNIVYILTDDWGYGDISALNSESKVQTPFTDRLAEEGMIFTDAHSNSSVCSPTRYGVLTGRYAWRSDLKREVVWGHHPLLVEDDRMTVASFLKDNGYETAFIGKWHLGWDWATTDGNAPNPLVRNPALWTLEAYEEAGIVDNIDYSKPLLRGPNDIGFTYSYGHNASLDIPPYVYVENGVVTAAPDRLTARDVPLETWRAGPAGADFDHYEVQENFTQRSIDYIKDQAEQGNPFFLYLPFSSPHTPVLPSEEFIGKSGLSLYGDFIMQLDRDIGRIADAVDEAGIGDNTIFIVTSDNGASPAGGILELEELGHFSNYIYRGAKADLYEGGHRVPFILRWPAVVEPGSVTDHTVSLTDLLATSADILGQTLPDNAGEDSVTMLPYLTGEATSQLRDGTIHHSIHGKYSIRQGDWKLLFHGGSGGWSFPRHPEEYASLPPLQLYNMKDDPSETKNVIDEHPELVKSLVKLTQEYIENGRSTPGEKQQNNMDETRNEWPGIQEVVEAVQKYLD